MCSDAAGSAQAPEPLLEMRGITKRFGAVQVLHGVDLTASAGEVVALVGDNGAGKSTLLRTLAGAAPADGGMVRIAGEEVGIDTPNDSADLGIATVYQDLALCDNMSVAENLFLGREPYRRGLRLLRWVDHKAMELDAAKLLARLAVTLPDATRHVGALSGGQRQTVAIARAMVGEPRIVVLDEPTAALGVSQTAQVLDLVRRLRASGKAVILVSHNMDDVMEVADRVTVLRLGRNNGEFTVADASRTQIVESITGATRLPAPKPAGVAR